MIELPFYLIAACLVSALWGWGEAFRQRRKAADNLAQIRKLNTLINTSGRKQTAELVSDHRHGLKELWYSSSYGWTWRCECGRQESISIYSSTKGTEERAILGWKSHVETHERLVLPTNELSHQACDARFVKVWDIFEQWRTACFCQSTNNDLILLNQEAKKLEKEPEKGVQLEA